MAGKLPSSSWSFLRDSSRLRGILKYQLESKDLFVNDVAKDLGMNVDRLRKYFRGVKPSITNWDLIRVANYLGVEVSLEVKLTPPK